MTVGRATRVLAAGVALFVTAMVGGCGTPGPTPAQHADLRALAVKDARAFLADDVAADGRVVRHDQGGDTVSEGQGYALLLAVALGDRRTFARVWGWTRATMLEPDGLFGYHWADGHLDPTPAADADVQIGWALDLAATRFSVPSLRAAARRVAAAVATHEIGYDDQGHPTLAAGPWAVSSGQPVTAEPGYWTPAADNALARLTGDRRWQALAASDTTHLAQLTQGGQQLPADWAKLGGGTSPVPTAGPAGTAVASGQDGLRALVWAGSTPAGRALDSRWWQLVRPTAAAAPLTRSLAGPPSVTDASPLSAVAAAASAQAAGDLSARDRLLATADTIQSRYPTYYGAAWTALGRVLLTTSLLAAGRVPD